MEMSVQKETVGIFWVIKGQVYYKKQEKEINNCKNHNIMNSDYGHFNEWDNLCGNKFTNADFATYPRGRVLYDIAYKTSVVYVDKCITPKEILKIVEIFALSNYVIKYDEHYSCDKCVNVTF